MKHLFPFFRVMDHVSRDTFTIILEIETFLNPLLESSYEFSRSSCRRLSQGIDKGHHRGNPLYRFL